MYGPWPVAMEQALFGMGCFWCSEALFVDMKGIFSTQVVPSPTPSYAKSFKGILLGRIRPG